jgi:hypothetical protein
MTCEGHVSLADVEKVSESGEIFLGSTFLQTFLSLAANSEN